MRLFQAQLFTKGGVPALPGNDLADAFNTNVVSTQLVTQAFLPLLRTGQKKKIINM